ncbi:MAG: YdeI/OmpD-associated family protein [Oscillospiraceae bacterium]
MKPNDPKEPAAYPDIPLGFGMALAQRPEAMTFFASLSNQEKTQIIRYIQGSTTGDMAKERVDHTVEMMSQKNHMF